LLRHGCNAIKQTDGNEKEIYEQILIDLEILNPDTWPESDVVGSLFNDAFSVSQTI
jgi:hypothetical protein